MATDNYENVVLQKNKDTHISLHMIVKRHLPSDAEKWSQEEILQGLSKVSHVRLDREEITSMDLELFGDSVTNLYLQHNLIERIENLEHLKNLQFLTLSFNKLKKIEGLTTLRKLVFLDLSYNYIKHFDTDQLPQSIAILNLKANRCCEEPNYRQRAVQALLRLRQLDELEISNEERRAAGLEVSSSEDEDDEVMTADGQGEERKGSFGSKASEMLLRSQERMESDLFDHKNRLQILSDIRAEAASNVDRK